MDEESSRQIGKRHETTHSTIRLIVYRFRHRRIRRRCWRVTGPKRYFDAYRGAEMAALGLMVETLFGSPHDATPGVVKRVRAGYSSMTMD